MSTATKPPVLLSMRPVLEERDDEAWFKDGFDFPEEVAEWRMAGFSRRRASEWVGVVREIVEGDEDVDFDDHETPVAVAAAFVAAGFTPEEAGEWGRVLPWVRCRELPLQAAEWRAAGFDPARAQEWAQTETLEDAVMLANGGWTPAERDLLDAWLAVHHPQGAHEYRRAIVTSGLPPAHALDYARAHVGLEQVAYLERLRREGCDLGDQLPDEAARSLDFAEAARLDELVDRLEPPHTGLHAQRLLRRPGRMRHTPGSPLAPGFPEPAFRGSWNSHGGGTWTRGYGEWTATCRRRTPPARRSWTGPTNTRSWFKTPSRGTGSTWTRTSGSALAGRPRPRCGPRAAPVRGRPAALLTTTSTAMAASPARNRRVSLTGWTRPSGTGT